MEITETDGILLRAFRDGDDLAFVRLYQRYKQLIYAFCLKMLGDSDSAGDVVQGVFLKLYERNNQIIHADHVKSWLMAIARNDCLTAIRKSRYQTDDLDESVNQSLMQDPHNIERDQDIAIVNDAISRLKPDLREVVILREFQLLSYKEIAEIVGTTENIVRSRLFTARQKLRAMLEPIYAERERS